MLHDEEDAYSYMLKTLLGSIIDQRTCPLIVSNSLAKLSATGAQGSSNKRFQAIKRYSHL